MIKPVALFENAESTCVKLHCIQWTMWNVNRDSLLYSHLGLL